VAVFALPCPAPPLHRRDRGAVVRRRCRSRPQATSGARKRRLGSVLAPPHRRGTNTRPSVPLRQRDHPTSRLSVPSLSVPSNGAAPKSFWHGRNRPRGHLSSRPWPLTDRRDVRDPGGHLGRPHRARRTMGRRSPLPRSARRVVGISAEVLTVTLRRARRDGLFSCL
jgi:hypothetical protein